MKSNLSLTPRKNMLMLVLALSLLPATAQTLAQEFKATSMGNPISPCVFCADPTALEYNGRLYVYGSNDHQSFIKRNKTAGIDYGDIKSLVVFSTADMENWTFHGTIDVQKLCSTWTGNPWYKGFMNSWAPSVTWRTNEDGKDEFFLYFANTSHGVGVLTADSPIGPWKSPLKESMINRDTPGALPNSAIFDPGVVIDENGTGWISFGGLDPNEGGTDIQPNNARFAKLTPSMTALDGPAVKIPAPYHFEANELNIIGGKFVYIYCSNWANRSDDDWNKYTSEHNISVSKPDACTMCYMVSDNPMDPDSWIYKGVYGKRTSSPNNHSHLHKFQGNYYHIYHSCALLDNMRNVQAIDNNAGGYRSICVNLAKVNESTQKINPVTPDDEGVDGISNMNPYELQEAETMATCGGINYEDFTNISKNGRISNLGNDASRNMQVKMKAGSWTLVRHVDFGTDGASSVMLRAKGEGTVEFRFGRKGAKASATFNISSSEMSDYIVDVDAAKFSGQKSIYIVVTSGTDVYLDAWQATKAQATDIHAVNSGKATESHSYDLSGRRISDTHQHRGIAIEQYTDGNGVKHTRKLLQTPKKH